MTIETTSRPARIRAWQALILYIILFAAVYWGLHLLAAEVKPHLHLEGLRANAAFAAATSIVLLWTEFAVMVLVLRLRGLRLADIGWRKPARAWGWIAAIVLAAAYAGMMLYGPLRTQPFLEDWSVFRIATALGIGITAGICEEAIFRGFVMTQARDAGMPAIAQIALSAILFGLAHVGWGAMSGQVNMAALAGAVGATAILGALLAGVYLASRRSLMPAVFAHGAIDVAIEPWLILAAMSGSLSQ